MLAVEMLPRGIVQRVQHDQSLNLITKIAGDVKYELSNFEGKLAI